MHTCKHTHKTDISLKENPAYFLNSVLQST